jgi:hypothetical protein
MSPLVICSRLTCHFVLPVRDRERGESTPTPRACPVCDAEVISFCLECGFPILGSVEERQFECRVCHSDLKRTFADRNEGGKHSVN